MTRAKHAPHDTDSPTVSASWLIGAHRIATEKLRQLEARHKRERDPVAAHLAELTRQAEQHGVELDGGR